VNIQWFLGYIVQILIDIVNIKLHKIKHRKIFSPLLYEVSSSLIIKCVIHFNSLMYYKINICKIFSRIIIII